MLPCLLFVDCTYVDYAHSATGFPTWHRQYLLWFEWEIQGMLQQDNNEDYYKFRIHYWDWRQEIQQETSSDGDGEATDLIFRFNRLGVTMTNGNGQQQVRGALYTGGWETICCYRCSGNSNIPVGTICNPNTKTGPLLRCPLIPGSNRDPCLVSNSEWPTQEHVNEALARPVYDTPNFETDTTYRSFRSLMEGYDNRISVEECGNSALCLCDNGPDCGEGASSPLQRRLHNTVSGTMHVPNSNVTA